MAKAQKQFAGTEGPKIDKLSRAVRKAHKLGSDRMEAQKLENKARIVLEDLMHDHAHDIANDDGDLEYKVDNIRAIIKTSQKLSVKADAGQPAETGVTVLDEEE